MSFVEGSELGGPSQTRTAASPQPAVELIASAASRVLEKAGAAVSLSRCVITMAEPFSIERRKLMRFMGAKAERSS